MAPWPGDRIAEEQAALRRVATLVARGEPPEAVFAAVSAEVGVVLGVDFTTMSRYHQDGAVTIVGAWSRTGAPAIFPVGTRLPFGGPNLHTQVFQTREPARLDTIAGDLGPSLAPALAAGIRTAVGVPISAEGRLWGLMNVSSTGEEPLSDDTEARLAGFTELVATAIANAQARVELRGFAEEQAALRRVATLVARGLPPEEVFTAVTAEVGQMLGSDYSSLSRYDPDGRALTVLGMWSSTGSRLLLPIGSRMELGGRNVTTQVFETGRPARLDDYAHATGAIADLAQTVGTRSSVGVPISVDGRLWGLMMLTSMHAPPHADTEERLAGFTELVATAVANAEARAALTESRARIVATADAVRRRIGRDLHDSPQQRLVAVTLRLRAAEAAVPPEAPELKAQLGYAVAELTGVVGELREIASGVHPAALAEGGLKPALRALARRSAVPARLDIRVDGRLPEETELAVYHVVAEALTNTARHASASEVCVQVDVRGDVLGIEVRDDGCGGATLGRGSGLVGIKDRVETLGGHLSLRSPPSAGTTVAITLPLGHGSKAQPSRALTRQPGDARPAADQGPSAPPR